MTKRNGNDGLVKRCACKGAGWPKCPHDLHFRCKPRRTGVHVRKNLQDLAGRRIQAKADAEVEVRWLKTAFDAAEVAAVATVDACGRKRIDDQPASRVQRRTGSRWRSS